MKRKLRKMMVGLMLISSLYNVAFAENSISIAVSCTIPAVPGLNVPWVAEKTTRIESPPEVTSVQQETQKLQEKTEAESPNTIQESKEKEIELADKRTSSVSIETLYVR
jgi:hypothetical protein